MSEPPTSRNPQLRSVLSLLRWTTIQCTFPPIIIIYRIGGRTKSTSFISESQLQITRSTLSLFRIVSSTCQINEHTQQKENSEYSCFLNELTSHRVASVAKGKLQWPSMNLGWWQRVVVSGLNQLLGVAAVATATGYTRIGVRQRQRQMVPACFQQRANCSDHSVLQPAEYGLKAARNKRDDHRYDYLKIKVRVSK